MKSIPRTILAFCFVATAASLPLIPAAQAHEPQPDGMHRHWQQCSPQEQEAWAKKHLDHEALMLEIKASQQSAWAAYAAAKLDLMSAMHAMKPDAKADDADAATIARRRADRVAQLGQKLATLADATEKLQATLGDDQRTVLDRIVRHDGHFHEHGFGHDMREHEMYGHDMTSPRPAAKAPAAKTPASKDSAPK